jgi:hypothetical protein
VSAKVVQLFGNYREVIGRSGEAPYLVVDALTEQDVRDAAAAAIGTDIPDNLAGVPLDEIEISEQIRTGMWRIAARYKLASWQDPPDGQFSFDTSGGTQHITQSRSTVRRYGPAATGKWPGAIGFDGKRVNGTDITVPVFNFTVMRYRYDREVTQAYKLALFHATGKFNNAPFLGFADGEVLFLGAAGSRPGDDPDDQWQLTFKFAAQENRTDIMIGDIGPITKLGWDLLWVHYDRPEVETVSGKGILIPKPDAVYVERVYLPTDFSVLKVEES